LASFAQLFTDYGPFEDFKHAGGDFIIHKLATKAQRSQRFMKVFNF
jgi:hypothetical protein